MIARGETLKGVKTLIPPAAANSVPGVGARSVCDEPVDVSPVGLGVRESLSEDPHRQSLWTGAA